MSEKEITNVKVILTWKSPHRWRHNKRTFYLPDNVEDIQAEVFYSAKELRTEKIELMPHWESPPETKIVKKR